MTGALPRGVLALENWWAGSALCADLAGEANAVRYANRRFMLREVPADWRDVENRVLDLEELSI